MDPDEAWRGLQLQLIENDASGAQLEPARRAPERGNHPEPAVLARFAKALRSTVRDRLDDPVRLEDLSARS